MKDSVAAALISLVGSGSAFGAVPPLVSQADTAVVQVSTTGKRDGKLVTEEGVGFLVKTNAGSVVLTAKHVVNGINAPWDTRRDNTPDRFVDFNLYTRAFGVLKHQKPTDAVRGDPDPTLDVAQVYVDFNGEGSGFTLSRKRPDALQSVYVLSWPRGEEIVQLRPCQVGNTPSSEQPLIRLTGRSGQFIQGESGSPVVDLDGRVVAILVMKKDGRTDGIGYALPVAEFANWFTNATYVEGASLVSNPNRQGTPDISYAYDHVVSGTKCTGRIEKVGVAWSEYIPKDAGCNVLQIDYKDLGSDIDWFYIYDPGRDMTARIPKRDGRVNWLLGEVPAALSKDKTWNMSQRVFRTDR